MLQRAAVLCLAVLLPAIQPAWADAKPINAVCTTGMVADMVQAIGGDRVKATALIGEGVDPHLYKPTRDDVAKMLKADILFSSGLMLEGRMSEVFARLSARGTPVVAVADSLPKEIILQGDGHLDPHVWMDPATWAGCTDAVRDALEKMDPAGADGYRERTAAYQKNLEALDAEIRTLFAKIPESQRVLVTAHDAFHYLARATGISVLGIQGMSTESEAGVSDINRLVDEVVNRRIPAIFVESSVSDKNVRAVIEGAEARGHKVKLGGRLYSDAMGSPGTPEGTYPGMIRHNAQTIVEGLAGGNP